MPKRERGIGCNMWPRAGSHFTGDRSTTPFGSGDFLHAICMAAMLQAANSEASAGTVQRVDQRESEQRNREHDAEINHVAVFETRAAGALDAVERPIGKEVQAGADYREIEKIHSTGSVVPH